MIKFMKMKVLMTIFMMMFVYFNTSIFAFAYVAVYEDTSNNGISYNESANNLTIKGGGDKVLDNSVKFNSKVATAFNKLMDEYKIIISAVTAIGLLTSILIFIIKFIQLGAVTSNPMHRRTFMLDLIWVGLTTTAIGGIAIILAVFYSSVL